MINLFPSTSPSNRYTRPLPTQSRPLAAPVSARDSLGINVHFLRAEDGAWQVTDKDLDMIQQAGFRRVRLDLLWGEVEKQKGIFDFRKYDWVINGLLKRGIRPMVILGLGNPNYNRELTIHPPEVQIAFERYAQKTVEHYRGLGLIYELINEPNHPNEWKPAPNVWEYMALANRILPALKSIDPTAFLAAPSTSEVPIDFLETCFQQGLLKMVDGVTIHPYQAFHKSPPTNRPPETFEAQFQQAQALVNRYAPSGKKIPVLLGEWGYSTSIGEVDEQTQANYLAREALLGIMYGSPVNIWYDWKGDIIGKPHNPANKEHNFEIVNQALTPKPAYYAMCELTQNSTNQQYVGRKPSLVGDYILQFGNGVDSTVVAWTTNAPHPVNVDGKVLQLTGKPLYDHPYLSPTNYINGMKSYFINQDKSHIAAP